MKNTANKTHNKIKETISIDVLRL